MIPANWIPAVSSCVLVCLVRLSASAPLANGLSLNLPWNTTHIADTATCCNATIHQPPANIGYHTAEDTVEAHPTGDLTPNVTLPENNVEIPSGVAATSSKVQSSVSRTHRDCLANSQPRVAISSNTHNQTFTSQHTNIHEHCFRSRASLASSNTAPFTNETLLPKVYCQLHTIFASATSYAEFEPSSLRFPTAPTPVIFAYPTSNLKKLIHAGCTSFFLGRKTSVSNLEQFCAAVLDLLVHGSGAIFSTPDSPSIAHFAQTQHHPPHNSFHTYSYSKCESDPF